MASLESLQATVAEAILHWDYDQDPSVALKTCVRSRRVSGVRISEIGGGPCSGRRSNRHDAVDMGDFVGVVCKLEGHEVCSSASGDVTLRPGDLLIWRNRGELAFHAEGWSRKLIMLIPAARFDAILRHPFEGNSLLLPGSSGLGALTPKFLTGLCDTFDRLAEKEAEVAIDMALDLVGLALDNITEDESAMRTTLYERILRYIDRRIQDPDLSPGVIADVHGISRRYLHLIFARHGETVSGWIRERRLLRCRDELQRADQRLSLTELAHRWGYYDSAHFSRSFKRRFGMPPMRWRNQMVRTP